MFSGKYIFFGNVNFRKRKMFPCVWLHFKKFSEKYFLVFGKEEGKHKSRKTQATTQKKLNHSSNSSSWISRRRDLAKVRSQSTARSCRHEIAIDGSSSRISRSSSTDLPLGSLAGMISRRRDCDQRRDRVRRFSSRARTRSLSLSFFGNALKGK